MQKFTRIAALVILYISCTYGQDEDLLGLPVDFDIFGLDPEDNFYKEREPSSSVSDGLLRRLCEEYDLQLDNKKLNCQNIRIVPKELDIAEHTIQKRDAEETPVEGSGEPDEVLPTNEEPQANADVEARQEESPSENQETAVETDTGEVVVPIVEEKASSDDQKSVTSEADKTELAEEVKNEDATPEESQTESEGVKESNPPTEEEAKFEPAVPYGGETSGNNLESAAAVEETKTEPSTGNENTTDEGQEEQSPDSSTNDETTVEPAVPYVPETTPSNDDGSANSETAPNTEEAAPSAPNTEEAAPSTGVPATDSPTQQPIAKKGRVLKPNEFDGPKSQDGEIGKESQPSKQGNEDEILHVHQSGNTIVDAPGSETLAGSDAVITRMSHKENIKESSNADIPKSGESSEETQQGGRKDTKVLIILLVAVVVIGGAAFAYNFIKKRKQKKSETSRTENGNAAIQKSAPTDKDAEQGTELKPLMRSTEPKPTVEYKDEKENAKTEVTN